MYFLKNFVIFNLERFFLSSYEIHEDIRHFKTVFLHETNRFHK